MPGYLTIGKCHRVPYMPPTLQHSNAINPSVSRTPYEHHRVYTKTEGLQCWSYSLSPGHRRSPPLVSQRKYIGRQLLPPSSRAFYEGGGNSKMETGNERKHKHGKANGAHVCDRLTETLPFGTSHPFESLHHEETCATHREADDVHECTQRRGGGVNEKQRRQGPNTTAGRIRLHMHCRVEGGGGMEGVGLRSGGRWNHRGSPFRYPLDGERLELNNKKKRDGDGPLSEKT